MFFGPPGVFVGPGGCLSRELELVNSRCWMPGPVLGCCTVFSWYFETIKAESKGT